MNEYEVKVSKMNEVELASYAIGVLSYIEGIKLREPGYFFDNFAEAKAIINKTGELHNEKLKYMALLLQTDIDEAEKRRKNPLRTPEEQAFYNHIKGINSWIFENRVAYPRIDEADTQMKRFVELNSKDSDTLAVMDVYTRALVPNIIATYGEEQAKLYIEGLYATGIRIEDPEAEIGMVR